MAADPCWCSRWPPSSPVPSPSTYGSSPCGASQAIGRLRPGEAAPRGAPAPRIQGLAPDQQGRLDLVAHTRTADAAQTALALTRYQLWLAACGTVGLLLTLRYGQRTTRAALVTIENQRAAERAHLQVVGASLGYPPEFARRRRAAPLLATVRLRNVGPTIADRLMTFVQLAQEQDSTSHRRTRTGTGIPTRSCCRQSIKMSRPRLLEAR